jgi:flagellar hook-associated protein 1 FlgK
MSGLFGSLSIALSALSVSQQEMATTSNNVANANTPGYTREVTDIAAGEPITEGSLSLGTGVVLQKSRACAIPSSKSKSIKQLSRTARLTRR